MPVFIANTSSTTGGGLSGLVFNTSGLVAEYRRQGGSAWTAITLAAGTLGTWASGGFVADGSLAGAYEIDLPDAVCAAGARWSAIRLYGAANMLPCLIEVEIDAVNYQDAVKFGLSAMPSNTIQVNGVAVSTADGTAQAGTSTTITLASADAAGTNAYVDRIITLVAGTGAGQSRYVTAYSSSTKVATVQRAWDTTPDATTQYAINDTAAAIATSSGDTPGTTTLLTRLPAALSFTGVNVNANAQAVADKAGYTASTVTDKTGYSLATAPPTVSQIAAGILLTPANLLATDTSNRVTTANPTSGGSTVTEATIWAFSTRSLTDKAGFAPAALTDYQQRAVAVTLPSTTLSTADHTAIQVDLTAQGLTTARAAKIDNLDAAISTRMATFTPATVPTVSQIAAGILLAPANLLATDGSNRVTTSNPAAGGSGLTDASVTADIAAGLTAQGWTSALAAGLAGDTPAAFVAALMNKVIKGATTFGQEMVELDAESVRAANIANTWNAATHVLTTVYTFPGDSAATITTAAQYPTSQVTNPALTSVSAAVGTVPQP